MSDSLNRSFRDLGLEIGRQDDSEESQLPTTFANIPKKKVLLTKKSLPEEEKFELTQESRFSQFEERKLDPSQTLENPRPNLKKRRLDREAREDLKQIKLSLNRPQQSPAIVINFRPQKKYLQETKVKAVELCERLGAVRVACSTGIPESSLRRWAKVGVNRLGASGRTPLYTEIEEDLLIYFKNMRVAGIPVNNQLLLREARRIANIREIEGFLGTLSWLDGFKRRHEIVYRRPTRVSQKLKPDSVQKLEEFQKEFLRLVELHGYPLEAICNIDETGVCFDMPLHHTLDQKGKKEVLLHTTGNDKTRITVLVSLTASNEFLPLFVILKGKKIPLPVQALEDGDLVVASNSTAWMTEETFTHWIGKVWRPYASRFPRSLLILDRFRVHMKESILSLLKDLNTDVLFIPPGLTFYVQPCDVYVNKGLKERIRQSWVEYMASQVTENGPVRYAKPAKDVLLLWVRDAMQRIELQDGVFERTILRNPQGLNQPLENEEEEEFERDYDLIQDEDYCFDEIE